MNKENYVMTDQYKRIQAATLKVLNKNYCVYKGVNTIGRNKTAIINLKHLNVSQQHAVIMIVDNSQHFISDLNSSNGTYLLGSKLSPYKLYELTNDVELKFGDLIATYSKVKDFDSTTHLEMEDADLTQNMTQNLYGVTTQLINESSLNQTKADRISQKSDTDLENIHEAVTQVVIHPPVITSKLTLNSDKTNYSPQISDNNIHDALTQVVDHLVAPTTSATVLFNDEETEVVFREPDKDLNHELIKTVDDGKTSSFTVVQDLNKKEVQEATSQNDEGNNIHELPTQVIHWPEELENKNTCDDTEKCRSDVLINDSFVQLQKKSNIRRIDESVIEESVLEEKTKTNENSNDSVDFLTLQQPFATDNENCDQANSDKVSTFPESQDIGQPRKKPVRKLSSSEDLTQPGKIDNSDSETDLEDDIENHKNLKKPLLDSDSDTEIEEERLPGRTSKDLDSGSETDIEDDKPCDDSLTQTPSVIKPKILIKKSILESDSETDIEEDKEKEPLKVAQNEDSNTTEILNDTDCIPATQDAFAEIFMYKDSKISKSTSSQNVSSEESFRLGLTELMVESVEHKAEEGTKSVNVENRTSNMNLIGDSEDQLLINKVEEKSISLNEESKKVVEENEPDEMYLLATQKIDTNISKDVYPKHDPYDESTQKLDINNENISQPQEKKSSVCIMPIQKLNQNETKKTDTEEEVPEDFYIMSTQKLEPDHEPQFKTPHKKFNFRKKGAVLDGSLSNIFSNNEDDLYMAATQQINDKEEKSEDFYVLATQKLNEEKNDLQMQAPQDDEDFYMASTQKVHIDLPNVNKIPESVSEKETNMIPERSIAPKVTAEKIEDCYVAPTQPLNSNVNNEQPVPAPDTDLYLQETQDLKVTKNAIPTNNEKNEDICDAPTQQINTVNDRENKEKELYVVETQQLNLNPSTSQVLQKQQLYTNETEPIKLNVMSNSKDDLYMAETEQINLESNKNNDVDPYIIPTQKLDQYIVENKKPLSNKSTVGTKRPVKTNSDTSQAKKIKKASDVEVETLSQIDAFIKESKPVKRPIRTEKNKSSKILEEETSSNVDQSETLSQIQRFVAEPFHDMKKLKTVPKKAVILKNLPKEVSPATSTQSEIIIKEPINNTKENKSVTSNINLQCENVSEEKFEVFQKPEKYSSSVTRSKSNQSQTKTHVSREDCVVVNKLVAADLNSSNETNTSSSDKDKDTAKSDVENQTHVSKEDCVVVNKLVVADLNISSETNTSSLYTEQDTVKSDVEKSFALLEAKSTKTRKSQRLNNAAEVKLTVCKNRRSMTTAAIPETSKDIPKNKPATRKTRRKSTNINNNNLASITENTETAVGGGSKRKLESIKSSEVFEAEKPSKVQKTNKIKKEQKEINELSAPSTSKQKAHTKKDSGHDLDNVGSSNSTISTISTPSRRGKRTKKEEVKEVSELSSPSTSKRKAISMKDSGHDGSSDSTVSTISTPSTRGKRNTQNATITSPEKTKRRQKPKIVFTMLDSPLLESLIKHLGGSVVDSVETSTVLVTGQVKRSQKLLTAIGQGKPICSPEWIHACKKANEFLDPWDFILLDKEAEAKWDFSLKESLTRASNEKLLGNYTFQLMVNNAADVLKGAIEACGGKCVPRHPAKNTEGFFVVVASPENRAKYLKIKKQHPHVTVVEPEAIFDGVLRQDLRLGRHLLT